MNAALLVELHTEELPPKSLKALSQAFAREITDQLIRAQLMPPVDAASHAEVAAHLVARFPEALAFLFGNQS